MAKNDAVGGSPQQSFTDRLNSQRKPFQQDPNQMMPMQGLFGGMGQFNPQGMTGNTGSMWNQPGIAGQPDANQLIRQYLNPPSGGVSGIGSGMGGLFF